MSRKKRSDRNRDDVNYWRSLSDVMIGLVLVLLLALMLLSMGLIDRSLLDGEGESENHYIPVDDDYDDYDDYGRWDDYDPDNETIIITAGGGGNKVVEEHTDDHAYDEPVETDEDTSAKCAVRVIVVDGETKQQIRVPGMRFEFYTASGAKKTLSTYYPKKITYESFETNDDGAFWLPEKLELGGYRITQISGAYGYDLSPDLSFMLEEQRDWDDPYILTVEMYPCRNCVYVEVTDAASGEGLKDCEFTLVAAEDILTADETLRYSTGDIASTFKTDSKGMGVSDEVYLGRYNLVQMSAPSGYASEPTDIEVDVARKQASGEEPLYNIQLEKTAVRVRVKDEATLAPVPDISYRIVGPETDLTVSTDKNGMLLLSDLKSDTVYKITESENNTKYESTLKSFDITVDSRGLIDGEVVKNVDIDMRMIRCEFDIKDRITGGRTDDRDAVLTNADGKKIAVIKGNELPTEIEGLTPGEYTLSSGNDSLKVTIVDTAESQTFVLKVWTGIDTAIIICAAAVAALIVVFVILRMRRNRLRKGNADSE